MSSDFYITAFGDVEEEEEDSEEDTSFCKLCNMSFDSADVSIQGCTSHVLARLRGGGLMRRQKTMTKIMKAL